MMEMFYSIHCVSKTSQMPTKPIFLFFLDTQLDYNSQTSLQLAVTNWLSSGQ